MRLEIGAFPTCSLTPRARQVSVTSDFSDGAGVTCPASTFTRRHAHDCGLPERLVGVWRLTNEEVRAKHRIGSLFRHWKAC